MKKLLWFLVGIAAGFVAAHFVNKDPRGREALAELDARITEFTDRMSDAYREQEASLEAIVDEAKRNAN
ncbi:ATPase [Microbacterium sp. ZW T5_56]|uniref:ATPase n=1 Tax=Microbacterium sp. ZW T5_56 TaxID=3378081 RepID=UPI0038524905